MRSFSTLTSSSTLETRLAAVVLGVLTIATAACGGPSESSHADAAMDRGRGMDGGGDRGIQPDTRTVDGNDLGDLAAVDGTDAVGPGDASDQGAGPRLPECNPLGYGQNCMMPFPTRFYTTSDSTTSTGRRLS